MDIKFKKQYPYRTAPFKGQTKLLLSEKPVYREASL